MKRLVVLLLFAALPAGAATFLVPDDRALVGASKAIVVATAGAAHTRFAPGGWIETVTAMHVDELVKGTIGQDSIDVVELGGVSGSLGYAVAGAPRYEAGERVLLFLETNDRGDWVAKDMAVGKFAFRRDVAGRRLLVRDDVCGWDYDGAPHREPLRDEALFLDFVRAAARGEKTAESYVVAAPLSIATDSLKASATATPAPSTYLLQDSGSAGRLGIRWSSFPSAVVFLSHGSQPGAAGGGVTAIQRGLAAWTNDSGSNIVYQYGGTTSIAQTGFGAGGTSDGVNTIQFNDPAGEIPGAFTGQGGDVLAIGGAWYATSGGGSVHTANGESYYTILEADLVVQNGISGAGLTGNGFDHVLTHELGHTLGLRHSDQPPAGGSSTSSAIMNSSVNFNNDPMGSTLQQWDRDAVAAVYGNGSSSGGQPPPPPPPTCNPPVITGQPVSAALAGAEVTLSVGVGGDAPFSYQWYAGAKGNTANAVGGATQPALSIAPHATTTYWVRVTNSCGTADSDAATVTVNGCPAVAITALNASSTAILEGAQVTLSVAASGGTVSYQWYAGTTGITSAPLPGQSGQTLVVKPLATSSYWVRASNSCGASLDSDTVTVSVTPCDFPAIVVQPAGANVVSGSTGSLAVFESGTTPMRYQWYEGLTGDTSRPVTNANLASMTTPVLLSGTSYWLRMSNACGSVDSDAAVVNVVPSCTPPVIVTQPPSTTVTAGSSARLTAVVSGASLTYQWYQGPLLDFTKPVGRSSPTLLTPAITAPTQFWLRVSSPCGTVSSTTINVTPDATVRRRPAKH